MKSAEREGEKGRRREREEGTAWSAVHANSIVYFINQGYGAHNAYAAYAAPLEMQLAGACDKCESSAEGSPHIQLHQIALIDTFNYRNQKKESEEKKWRKRRGRAAVSGRIITTAAFRHFHFA